MAAYKGECFCGTVRLEVSGEPEGMGYCHCRSCRSWSGGPVNAFTLWKPEAVRVTAGAEHIGMYQKTPVSERQYCKKCGGHLMANHPPLGPLCRRSRSTRASTSTMRRPCCPCGTGCLSLRIFPRTSADRAKWSPNRRTTKTHQAARPLLTPNCEA